ncbi:MAG: hypothetical protein C4548_03075 [Desulfobacteraceae bacterium]|nr:MAG: hypothetical protein C4548_03075 [Desulfobacteraceae bacterium]
MKKHFLRIGVCCLCFFVFGLPDTVCGAPTKVLINIVEEQGDTSSAAMIKSSEMLIARELLKHNLEVMTSDDIAPREGLSEKDVKSARAGSMTELRKAAAFNGAAFILSAKARTVVSEEDVLNMKMNKAVTSFSYRIVGTAGGSAVDMDSLSFSSASRSPEDAAHGTYQKLSADIAQRVKDKLPAQLSAQESKKLAGYRASVTPKPPPKPKEPPAPAATPASPAPPAMTVAQAPTGDNAETTTAPKAGDGPEIVILNPPPTRGFMPVSRVKELKIEGMAMDPSGIAEVRINGEKVGHDSQGRFEHPVALRPGENRFLVMAVNTAGRMVSKEVAVDRDKDADPPDVVLLRPSVTRGFQVALKPDVKKTIVEGIVKDDSDLLFLRVNNADVAVSDTGHFQHELAVTDATRTISIEAADIYGNITRKSLEVARGDDAWVETPTGPGQTPGGPTVKPVLWGLAIGVSKYSSSAIDLRYADQDAMKLEKFFTAQAGKSFSEVHFKTLINEQVTRNSIIEGITRHLGMAAPDDIIFLFVAGHGIKHRQSGSYYFMPSDADFDTVLAKGLRMSDFEESIKILSNNVHKIIVAMDTCHSGALEVGMRSGGGASEDLAAAINEASGLYILSASKAGEVSMESDQFKLDPKFPGHGAFTFALVEAMRGDADYDKDGYVSVNEMFQFVARQVPRITKGQQHPYFRMQGTDLPLVGIQ